MKKNFWQKLKKPIMCLAPMADVTDAAFRSIIAKYGKPDIFFTEFTSADGLCNLKGRKSLIIRRRRRAYEKSEISQRNHPFGYRRSERSDSGFGKDSPWLQ